MENEAYEALTRYFNSLKYLGYKSYSEVEHLLCFLFIEEMLDGPMSEFITETDYNAISNLLYCLYGSCTIPYPTYLKGMAEVRNNTKDRYRYTETEVLRTIDKSLRVLS